MALIFESFLYDFVAFLVFCAVILHLYIRHIYSYWEKRNVKYVKPTFPFGNFKDAMLLKKTFPDVYSEMYNSTDDKILGVYTTTVPELLVRDPELIRLILIKDFQCFHDRGVYCHETMDPLSAHLFSLNGEKWRNLRANVTPAFSSGKLKGMFFTILNCGKSIEGFLTKRLNEEIDVRDLTASYTINVIASVAFGLDMDTILDPSCEFRDLGRRFFEPTVKTAIRQASTLLVPHVGRMFRVKSVDNNYEEFIYRILKETMTFREKNNVQRKDFLQLLLQLKNTGKVDSEDNWNIQSTGSDNNSKTLTFHELAAQIHLFFQAGYETTSATISFCLYQLAKQPSIQAKVQEEIDEVIKKHNGEITYEAVMEMKYMESCIDETLRLHSSLAVLSRECTREYELPGTGLTLEKGTRILIPVHAIQCDSKYYSDPEEFKPERFLQEHPNSGSKGIIYMPFGEGPRICIGLRMGKMEAKIALLLILSKFNVHLGEHLRNMKKLRYEKKSFLPQIEGGTFLKFSHRK
ncbi:hypothetical protein DMENIID0001_152680 [Sergentomyia squamirostris]